MGGSHPFCRPDPLATIRDSPQEGREPSFQILSQFLPGPDTLCFLLRRLGEGAKLFAQGVRLVMWKTEVPDSFEVLHIYGSLSKGYTTSSPTETATTP
jgi:hypothetical protein